MTMKMEEYLYSGYLKDTLEDIRSKIDDLQMIALMTMGTIRDTVKISEDLGNLKKEVIKIRDSYCEPKD